ncbi:MAG: septation protein SepH [Phycicoccus sp.]
MAPRYPSNPGRSGVGSSPSGLRGGIVIPDVNLDREPDMQDLRLIGVHEDGEHLLLSDADGGRFRLPLDEPLRAAARRDRARLGQLQIEIEGGLRPREVQALIRRGLSAAEVAERAGWTVEKVRRFEGPVLAEREHVTRVARQCVVGSGSGGPAALTDRVDERLRSRGVDVDEVEWDSARDEKGVWRVSMTFAAGGRRRTAAWIYEPLGGSVSPTDDEARWLGEDAEPAGIPAPHPAATGGELDVYDVDADGGVSLSSAGSSDPIDLMAAMREHSMRGRRGRRRPTPTHMPGEDRPRAEALPLDDLDDDPVDAPPPAPAPATARSEPPADQHLDDVPGPPEKPAPAAASRRPVPARKGRPSVPSWDDIVFGTRGGTDT